MRIRSIKPEFWRDELLAKWTAVTRLAYIGMWSEADDYGRIRWLSEYLRAAIFPYDTRLKMDEVIKPIEESRRVFVYEVAGNKYAVIISWPKHQRINRKSRPQLPDPPEAELRKFIEDSVKAQCGLTECSVSTHGYYHEDSVRAQRPSRARAEQGAGSREQGAGSRDALTQGSDSQSPDREIELTTKEGLLAALRATGRFPNFTMEGLVQGLQSWPGSEQYWPRLVVEARDLAEPRISNPVAWVSRVLGRYVNFPKERRRPDGEDEPPRSKFKRFDEHGPATGA